MSADPLSDSTRKARKSLLICSCALFVTVYFDAKISDIPFAGIELTIKERALPIILGVGLGYFLISFLFYAIDDLINMASTPFQSEYRQKSSAVYQRAVATFESNATAVFKQYIDFGEAESISKELARFVNVVGNDRESFFQERIRYGLKSFKHKLDDDNLADLDVSLMNIYQNIHKNYETYSKDAQMVSERLYMYSKYRKIRLYLFELAFPVIAAVSALILALI